MKQFTLIATLTNKAILPITIADISMLLEQVTATPAFPRIY